MYLQAFYALGLASTAVASVVNFNIYTDGDASSLDQVVLAKNQHDDEPAWRKRDKDHLVPLVPEARTGAVPVEVEESLIYALGPRFANEFIKAAAEEAANTSSVASCNVISCAGTIIKASPCIVAAAKCKCTDPLKHCPASGKDICKCVDCLPGPLRDFINKIGFCKNALEELPGSPHAVEESVGYADFVPFSQRAPYLLAYRGDLPGTTLAEAQAIAVNGFCPGSPCGRCPCCLGVCLPIVDQCVGACLPLESSLQSSAHQEL